MTSNALSPLIVFMAASTALAQAVPSREPTGTHIFPAGGRRGTTVKVRVGGECFPPEMRFTLTGSGVKAPPVLGFEVSGLYEPSARRTPRDADGVGANMTYPREWESQIEIAADAPPGTRLWRASGGFGGTAPRPFLVGDLPEHIERESNSRAETAEPLTLPVVVNGQVAGERDLDFYAVACKAGDVIVCDLFAARIASPLDPVIEVFDPHGARMTVDELRGGTDPVIAFRAPADGQYRLSLANVGFGGGPAYVYRMTVSTAPFVAFTYPTGGLTGETRDLELFALSGTGAPQALRERVAFPTTAGGFLFRNTAPLWAGTVPELVDSDAPGLSPKEQPLPVPAAVSGRFLSADDEDWFEFTAKTGERFSIGCRPFPETSLAIPGVAILDTACTTLTKAQGLESPSHACDIEWQAPADGTYRILVRDLLHGTRGGPEFLYRLTLDRAKPGFAMVLEPDYVNVVQGGRTEVDLLVRRTGGFAGAIDLSATLPAGVRIEPAQVPAGQPRIKLAIVADESARPGDAPLVIDGQAMIDGQPHKSTAQVRGLLGTRSDPLSLTVQHRPMFRLTCSEAYQYAHRGTIYGYAMQLERLHGFDGPVTVQLADRQVQDLDGIEMVEQVVPPGVSQFDNLVYLPETMHVSVQHHSRPYAQAWATFTDAWGQKQTLLAVSEKRCMIRTLPTVVRLRALDAEVTLPQSGTIPVRLALDRTPNSPAEMDLELVSTAGFSADKVRIGTNASEATLSIKVDGSGGTNPRPRSLLFRATGKHSSGATVVTETAVKVKR